MLETKDYNITYLPKSMSFNKSCISKALAAHWLKDAVFGWGSNKNSKESKWVAVLIFWCTFNNFQVSIHQKVMPQIDFSKLYSSNQSKYFLVNHQKSHKTRGSAKIHNFHNSLVKVTIFILNCIAISLRYLPLRFIFERMHWHAANRTNKTNSLLLIHWN